MPRRKKERGRPLEKPYPPRIDVTADVLATAVLNMPPRPLAVRDYNCAACARPVHYPETLYADGRCEACHAA